MPFLLLLTIPMDTMLYTNKNQHALYLFAVVWLYPCRISCTLLQGHGNSCTGELQQPNCRCFGRESATTSFGLRNSFQRTSTTIKQQNWSLVICSAYNTHTHTPIHTHTYTHTHTHPSTHTLTHTHLHTHTHTHTHPSTHTLTHTHTYTPIHTHTYTHTHTHTHTHPHTHLHTHTLTHTHSLYSNLIIKHLMSAWLASSTITATHVSSTTEKQTSCCNTLEHQEASGTKGLWMDLLHASHVTGKTK